MASKIVYDQYQRKKRIKINYFHEYIQKLMARKKKWNAKKKFKWQHCVWNAK